jgi:hypothetical protein
MGSRQIAVKAFLDAAVSDDMMLDRWIPDEDWVRQIRENGETDYSVVNLNTGLALQCVWQNNHATLHDRTVFYNKKKIRTSKTIARANKNIRFYYVVRADKPAPIVPSDLGFYQSLWDDLDRSTRSLKRTAPSQANKASSARRTQPPEKALTDRGKTFVGLSITEKLTRLDGIMKTNEESTNGEFNVDFGKFFKKQATNLDVTIFEET